VPADKIEATQLVFDKIDYFDSAIMIPSSRGVSPNRGKTIHANNATPGTEPETAAAWQKAAGIDISKQVKLVRLSHMRYQHRDMDKITIFLKGTYFHL
jgi:hypothetical protein